MQLPWQVLKQVVERSWAINLVALLAEPMRFTKCAVRLILSEKNVDLEALPWAAA